MNFQYGYTTKRCIKERVYESIDIGFVAVLNKYYYIVIEHSKIIIH